MSKQFNIFGDIVANDGDRWFESDVVPSIFVGWLSKQEGDIEVNINSNGGDVAGGLAIANAIKAYAKGDVTCNVLGVAASMASVIACAGKRLCMGQGSFLMIHNPWTVTMGDADDLRRDAETLDKMRDSILSFYQGKCPDKTADDFRALMDAETWISREEAPGLGFVVDDYSGELRAAAALTRRAFSKAPDAAKALVEFHDRKPARPGTAEGAKGASPKPETAERRSERSEAEGAKGASPDNWEARFRGLSAKYNDLQRRALADLAERDDEIKNLKSQLDAGAQDLAAANAKVSELASKLDESSKALQAANADLAATRDSLQKAEDKASELEKTRDLLTAGVLTPAPEATYADKMNAAKTPEEREALRAQKRAGKIK